MYEYKQFLNCCGAVMVYCNYDSKVNEEYLTASEVSAKVCGYQTVILVLTRGQNNRSSKMLLERGYVAGSVSNTRGGGGALHVYSKALSQPAPRRKKKIVEQPRVFAS